MLETLTQRCCGWMLILIGAVGCGVVLHQIAVNGSLITTTALAFFAPSLLVLALGAIILLGPIKKTEIQFGSASIEVEYFRRSAAIGTEKPRQLDEQLKRQREAYAKEKSLPGANQPALTAVERVLASDLLVRPSAYPMTPMYLLDKSYRILDWNEAFSLVFDRTMEGRGGQSILEWVYFLDNYQEVLDHGEMTFGGAGNLPLVDVEEIKYTSLRYDKIHGVKRAYRIPDDQGQVTAWLVTIQLSFSDGRIEYKFQDDLIRYLGLNHMWSEYAMSYDAVLNNTSVYRDLIDTMTGRNGLLPPLNKGSHILDLGAGTGNVSLSLAKQQQDHHIFSVENNRIMLDLLRSKCRDFLVSSPNMPGIFPIKQDITSLFGIKDEEFDYAIMNNVLYAIDDYKACLDEISRVVKRGGELRISGPRRDTRIDVLFDRIEKDLKARGIFDDLKERFEHVYNMNQLRLKPLLHRWTTGELQDILRSVGFSHIICASENVYANQSMLLCARKPL